MSLTIAAQLADDKAPGGFQTKAVAAMVNKAQTVLVSDATTPEADKAYARQFLANPDAWARSIVWLVLSVDQVHATANPADATIVAAASARWGYFVRIGG